MKQAYDYLGHLYVATDVGLALFLGEDVCNDVVRGVNCAEEYDYQRENIPRKTPRLYASHPYLVADGKFYQIKDVRRREYLAEWLHHFVVDKLVVVLVFSLVDNHVYKPDYYHLGNIPTQCGDAGDENKVDDILAYDGVVIVPPPFCECGYQKSRQVAENIFKKFCHNALLNYLTAKLTF